MPLEHLIGRRLGPCRLDALLGSGGRAAVFRATHLALERAVAVKVIVPGPAATDESFLREARLAARLEDPRIVQVYDAGREGDWRYIVMQLVEGESLAARVRRAGGLKTGDAFALMLELLKATAVAHGQGVIHRDLKPDNVIIDARGGVRLADFGIAAGLGAPSEDGWPEGSFDYMAPEQAFGAAPDPRADLYALGGIWFFCLTGRAPYQGSAGDLMLQHRESPVPNPRLYRPEIPPGAASLIMKLLSKDPNARPGSAEETLAAAQRPGVTLALDESGDPVKLLPPPPEPEPVGVAADPAAQAFAAQPTPYPKKADAVPPPPPALFVEPPRWSWLTSALWAGVIAFVFAPYWTKLSMADLLAAGAACGAGLWLIVTRMIAGLGTGLFALSLWGGLAYCAFTLVLAGRQPAASPGLEAMLSGGLAAIAGLAGVYLGAVMRPPERLWAGALLAASAAGAALAGAALGDSGELLAPIAGGFCGAARELAASGGAMRWLGFLAAFGVWRLSRLHRCDRRAWSRRGEDAARAGFNK